MDTGEMQELLRGYLGEMDWNGGATKNDLLGHLAGRDEPLRTMLNAYVAEGTYADIDAVLTVIPAQAWQDVQGDAWRGPASLDPADAPSGFSDSPVGGGTSGAPLAGEPPPSTQGMGRSAAAPGGNPAPVAGPSPRAGAETAAASPWQAGSSLGASASVPERLVPVALSALAEGLGQAYNRQPAKAAGLLLLGLGLSTASGLNTWLARRLFRAPSVTIGTDRIRPLLLTAWAATYAFNLWDAWTEAARSDSRRGPTPG